MTNSDLLHVGTFGRPQGLKGNILTDNIIINLITKNVEIFMNKSNKKVTVNTN